jgi:restriction system protein
MRRRRYRDQEQSVFDSFIDALLILPWWAGVALALFSYASMRWLIPWILQLWANQMPQPEGAGTDFAKLMFAPITQILRGMAAPVFVLSLVVVAIGRLFSWLKRRRTSTDSRHGASSEMQSSGRRRKSSSPQGFIRNLLDGTLTLKDVGQFSWSEFEELLAALFQRAGFGVERTGRNTADGGVDLVLTKDAERAIVQCKHWQVLKVPVSVIREQLGLKQSRRAHYCIVVTSGYFTQDAITFACENGIILLDGTALQTLLSARNTVTFAQLIELYDRSGCGQCPEPVAPVCPECGAKTTKKLATRGRFKGQPFWACERYPICYGKIDAGETELT